MEIMEGGKLQVFLIIFTMKSVCISDGCSQCQRKVFLSSLHTYYDREIVIFAQYNKRREMSNFSDNSRDESPAMIIYVLLN